MGDVGNHDENFELKGDWILLKSKEKSVGELLEELKEKRQPGTLTYNAEKGNITVEIEDLPHNPFFSLKPLGILGVTPEGLVFLFGCVEMGVRQRTKTIGDGQSFSFTTTSFWCNRMMISHPMTVADGEIKLKMPDAPPWEEKTFFKEARAEYKNMVLWKEGLLSGEKTNELLVEPIGKPGETQKEMGKRRFKRKRREVIQNTCVQQYLCA